MFAAQRLADRGISESDGCGNMSPGLSDAAGRLQAAAVDMDESSDSQLDAQLQMFECIAKTNPGLSGKLGE